MLMESHGYSRQYYERLRCGVFDSAQVIVPIVLDLLDPASVVDVGCGTAEWAAAFKSCGVPRILGVDGDYIERRELAIAPEEFMAADLTKPLHINDRFDLALSLEVAEHLPAEYAETFVTTLTRLAPAVLFSAAIPHQGGEQHVNEQWPQYWAKRFGDQNYVAFDIVRPQVWTNRAVQWWYAQNTLLYVEQDYASQVPKLSQERPVWPIPALVHANCFEQLAWKCRVSEALLELIRHTPADACILLVDEYRFGELPKTECKLRPFTVRDGLDHGLPKDSQTACQQLQAQMDCGATHIAFAWPSFWWLEHYGDLATYLRERCREIMHSDNWIVFSLSDSQKSNVNK
jgi:SAM-dependent methyltransferase